MPRFWVVVLSIAGGAVCGAVLLAAVTTFLPSAWESHGPGRDLGALVEVRDAALARVLTTPDDADALEVVVSVERRLAADDAEALRAQAAAYAEASAQAEGDPDPDGSADAAALRMLALADLLAATRIERAQLLSGPPAQGVRPVSALAGGEASAPAALPAQGASSPQSGSVIQSFPSTHPAPSTQPASAQGPSPAKARAAAKPKPTEAYYLVVSTPLSRAEAEAQAGKLVALGLEPLLRREADGGVRLQAGAFQSAGNAEALARRASASGVPMSVMRASVGAVLESLSVSAPAPQPQAAPRSVGQLMDDGLRLYQEGWYGPALAHFRQAAQMAPRAARPALWWGRAAYRAARFAEAQAALERVIALAGDGDAGREARGLLRRIRAEDPAPQSAAD